MADAYNKQTLDGWAAVHQHSAQATLNTPAPESSLPLFNNPETNHSLTPDINFSVEAEREMKNIHNCVDELAAGANHGTLHDTPWGKDIIVPRGRYGKKGFGVEHMHEKRLLHGFTEDEAAFIIVCAMKAAETVETPTQKGNSLWFDKFGIRAV